MHLLHLIEPFCETRTDRVNRVSGTDAAATGAAACMESESYHTQAALLVGPRSAEIRARQLGISSFDTVCPIYGSSRHGVTSLQRVLACRTAPERTIVWSSHLEQWAQRMRIAIVRPWNFPLAHTEARIRAELAQPSRRAMARAQLGVQDDVVVIALADDPPIEADLWAFVSVLTMLESGGVKAVGIAPRAAAQRGRARRFFRTLGLAQGLLIVDEPVWSLSDAIDMAFVGPGMWTRARDFGEPTPMAARELAWARVMAAERMMQRGVPTVSMDEIAVLPSLKRALVAEGKSSAIASKLLALAESPALRHDIAQRLTTGVPAHARALAARVLWRVTAMPGDVEPIEAHSTLVTHG